MNKKVNLAELEIQGIDGAKQRVKKVLCIMLTAWASAQLKRAAESMLSEIE